MSDPAQTVTPTESMKALSIQQPWAWLITHGYKSVENRTWPTNVRGRILIHAGKKIDAEAIRWLRRERPDVPLPDEYATGGVVGEATLTDCVTDSDDPYFFGPYGFVLTDARVLPFRAVRGMLGFFNIAEVSP